MGIYIYIIQKSKKMINAVAIIAVLINKLRKDLFSTQVIILDKLKH